MAKAREKVCFVVMAKSTSERVPYKMIRPIYDGVFQLSLVDIIAEKFNQMIDTGQYSRDQFYFAVDNEVAEVVKFYDLSIIDRSEASLKEESNVDVLFEWSKELSEKYDYVILVNACLPFLNESTIRDFFETFVSSDKENLFAVTAKKNFYWNATNGLLSPLPDGFKTLNTKFVEPTYEAAHALYASRLDIIHEKNVFMTDDIATLNLYVLPESVELLDIDEDWQFVLASLALTDQINGELIEHMQSQELDAEDEDDDVDMDETGDGSIEENN